MNPAREKSKEQPLPLLTLAAIGVVFGDIGTSPLYALKQCLKYLPGGHAGPEEITGLLSLVFWSLVLVVCVMYLGFILRADHEGEGGTLALLGLIRSRHPVPRTRRPGPLILLVVFGSTLLLGDGVITPSISVLSAVEGLDVATKAAHPFILPLALGILLGLFMLQPRGTGLIGKLFGPVMVIWFVVLAILGVISIMHEPRVLAALNPIEAAKFLIRLGWPAFGILGAVVLCFSGVEALFADLGHFGRAPIQIGWYAVAFPALVLNYFGQGAAVLAHHGTDNPFYRLVPGWGLYPMVALSTMATIIASQAVIAGVFSLGQQAINMGISPRMEVLHTSREEKGQIYVPLLNIFLAVACASVVLIFRSSDALGSAYGLAVIGTMTISAITFFVVLRSVRKWPLPGAVTVLVGFLMVDLSFLAGSSTKILSGAWLPLLIALTTGLLLVIWLFGRAGYFRELKKSAMPIKTFCAQWSKTKDVESGIGVFLTSDPESIPLVGTNEWLRQNLFHEHLVLLTIQDADLPFVSSEKTIQVEKLGPHVTRIHTSFGFTQSPDVTKALHGFKDIDWKTATYYLPHPCVIIHGSPPHRLWVRIYRFMARNAMAPVDYFKLPPDQIIYAGLNLKL